MKTPEGRWLKKIVCWKFKLAHHKHRHSSQETHHTHRHTSQELDAIEEAPSHADDLVDPASQDPHVFEDLNDLDYLSTEDPAQDLPPLDNSEFIESLPASIENIDDSPPVNLEDTAVQFQIGVADDSPDSSEPAPTFM